MCSDPIMITICCPQTHETANFSKNWKACSTVSLVHISSMCGGFKGLSYWFSIGKNQSMYQCTKKEALRVSSNSSDGLLKRQCAKSPLPGMCPSLQGLRSGNRSCQHLHTYNEKVQLCCMKKQNHREKIMLHSHLNITEGWRITRVCSLRHVPDTILLLSVSCSPWWWSQ